MKGPLYLWRRFRAHRANRRVEREVNEELSFHLERREEDNLAAGMSPEAARQDARRRFGDRRQVAIRGQAIRAESLPANRGEGLMTSFVHDLRQAARGLRRAPGITVTIVLTLGLGLGATTTIFTFIDRIVIDPLAYPDSDRLVWLGQTAPGLNFNSLGLAPGLYGAYVEHAETLEELGYYRHASATLTSDGDPERVRAAVVSSGLLTLLRVQPSLGRLFTVDDDAVGSTRVALLGHDLWLRRYNADPAALGRTIDVDGQPHVVVGILPQSFDFPSLATELWLDSEITTDFEGFGNFGGFDGLGRMRLAATLEDVRVDMDRAIARLLERSDAAEREMIEGAGLAARPTTLRARVITDVGLTLWILFGATAFVLSIACANVANLLLVRAQAQQRETAVRTALGASRLQLARRLLAESTLLGLLGGGVGLLLAAVGVRYLVRIAPSNLPRAHEVVIDADTLAFLLLSIVGVTVLLSLVPLLRRAPDITAELRDGGRGSTTGARRLALRRMLVVAQVALALILLVGSGVMARSFQELKNRDPGFEVNNVLRFSLALPAARYPGAAEAAAFHGVVLDALRALPGVVGASAGSTVPLEGVSGGVFLYEEGVTLDESMMPPVISWARVSEHFVETLQIPLFAGRTFERGDARANADVVASGLGSAATPVLINRALADLYWPDVDPIGRRVHTDSAHGTDGLTWLEIVGVVGNYALRLDSTGPPEPLLFLPLSGGFFGAPYAPHTLTYSVRTERAPQALAEAVRATVWRFDKLPIVGLQTMRDVAATAGAPTAFIMILLAVASTIALALGCVGVYGVVAHVVRERTGEIGVRMALGARCADVRRMLLSQGAALGTAGVAVGLVGSYFLISSLQGLLFGISALDPGVHLAVAVALLLVVLLATYLPARRASRIDPVAALRGG